MFRPEAKGIQVNLRVPGFVPEPLPYETVGIHLPKVFSQMALASLRFCLCLAASGFLYFTYQLVSQFSFSAWFG